VCVIEKCAFRLKCVLEIFLDLLHVIIVTKNRHTADLEDKIVYLKVGIKFV
jgi:predicted transcriptional regulator